MATGTVTVTVNAAFLQEIKQDSLDLRGYLRRSGAVFGSPRLMSAQPKHVAKLLARVRDQLALHFALEAAFGYFDDPLKVAPRLCQRADALRAQHVELFRSACALAEEAEQLVYHESPHRAIRHLARHWGVFQRRLQIHESAENRLILDAFDDDIGDGD